MNEETAITKQSASFGEIERVLMTGDLSKLTSEQRVEYYNAVCKSTGINPLTRPFDYIQLNGKLTLYAKKDAADQLRKINGVSIDDIDISEVGDTYLVKVKGHDQTGRGDVEIGVVKKSDMQGNSANAQMKAVTKAKRRLTLSLCGLGWLDETEIETIPSARPVVVAETGEIITPMVEGHAVDEPAPEQPKPEAQKQAAQGEIFIGSITPVMLVDAGLSESVPAAAQLINKLHIAGKPAADNLPLVRLYRAHRDAGKDSDAAAAAALNGEKL